MPPKVDISWVHKTAGFTEVLFPWKFIRKLLKHFIRNIVDSQEEICRLYSLNVPDPSQVWDSIFFYSIKVCFMNTVFQNICIPAWRTLCLFYFFLLCTTVKRVWKMLCCSLELRSDQGLGNFRGREASPSLQETSISLQTPRGDSPRCLHKLTFLSVWFRGLIRALSIGGLILPDSDISFVKVP